VTLLVEIDDLRSIKAVMRKKFLEKENNENDKINYNL
jgi:hypothetical protein